MLTITGRRFRYTLAACVEIAQADIAGLCQDSCVNGCLLPKTMSFRNGKFKLDVWRFYASLKSIFKTPSRYEFDRFLLRRAVSPGCRS